MRPTAVAPQVDAHEGRDAQAFDTPGDGSRRANRVGSSGLSVTGRQRLRIQRSQKQARRRQDLTGPSHALQSTHHSLVATEIRRPDYWRDLSIEIAGTILSAVLIFGFGRILGYIERPSVQSELLSLLGLLVTGFAVLFVLERVRRVRAHHPGASGARLFLVYLRAIKPYLSIPTLVLGVALCLGNL